MKPLPPRWHPRGLQRKPPVYSLFGLVEIFNIFKEDLAPGPELTWLPVPPGKVSFSTSPSSSRLTRGEGPSPKEPGADPHQRGGSFPHRPRAPPGPDVPPIPPCRPLHLEHRPAPGTQGSPAGCRVHRMGPALQSPDQGTVLGRQRAPGTQGGLALAMASDGSACQAPGLPRPHQPGGSGVLGVCTGRRAQCRAGHPPAWLGPPGRRPGLRWSRFPQSDGRRRAAGTVMPAPHHDLGAGRGPWATTGLGTDTTTLQPAG